MQTSRRCVLVGTILGALTVESARAQEELEWFQYAGHEYAVVTTSKTWDQAQGDAETDLRYDDGGIYRGGETYLASITTAEEEAFIRDTFGPVIHGAWIGGWQNHDNPDYSEPAGGWEWVSGEPWDYTNWNAGEPNDSGGEDHLQIGFGGEISWWNDQLAVSSNSIVERESPDAEVLIESTFDTGDEGWSIVEVDATNDPIEILNGPFSPAYCDSCGNPGGAISWFDIFGAEFYFDAPEAYLGDQSRFYGATLCWDTRNDPFGIFEGIDVALFDGETVLVNGNPPQATTEWQTQCVTLDETEGWRLGTLAGDAPTDEQFLQVLNNLELLRIRGEFRSGEETGYLDNVRITGLIDCNSNGISDSADIAAGTSQDCNGNGVPDECDIEDGTSQNCDADGVPDECELDTDGDGEIDDCDADDDTDGVPDESDVCRLYLSPGGVDGNGRPLGDFDLDCDVDLDDYTVFSLNYIDGEVCLNADSNKDTVVDPLDVGYSQARFGQCGS